MLLTLSDLILQSFGFSFVGLACFFRSLGQIIGLGLLDGQVAGELFDLFTQLIALSLCSVKLTASSMEVGVECSKSL